MVRKVSLYKIALKNFTGTNINKVARKKAKKSKKVEKFKKESRVERKTRINKDKRKYVESKTKLIRANAKLKKEIERKFS